MLRWMTAVMGPVFAKEMVEMARRKRYYFNRVLYGGVLLFALFLIWNSYSWQMRYANTQAYRLMARMAEDLFQAVSWVQLGAVFLFVPVFLCGVIAAEREEHTLDLLFTTNLTDREIVLGKLLSRVTALVLLIVCAMPVLSLIMLFGGIDPQALGRGLAATLFATLYAGAHAIYFSATTKSPLGALVRAYWWMALWLCGLPMTVFLVVSAVYRFRSPGPFGMYCLGSLPFLNPIGAFAVAVVTPLYNQMAGLLGSWFFPLIFALPASWSLLLIHRAVRRLRSEPTPSLLALRPTRRLASADPAERKRAEVHRRHQAGRTWFGLRVRNPFWLRARQARVYDREGYIGRIQWAAWLVAFFFIGLDAATHPRGLRDREASLAFLIPTWLVVAVFLALLAGMSLVGDRRRGFLDLVLTTPLTGRETLDGTMLGVWQHVRRIYWLPWVLGLFLCLTTATFPGWFLAATVMATLFGAVLLVHGTVCALVARGMAPALIFTFLLPVLSFIGTLLLVPMFEHATGQAVLILALLVRIATTFAVRWRVRPGVVAGHLLATHFLLVTLFTCWAWQGGRGTADTVATFHPAYWLISLLTRRPEQALPDHVSWFAVFTCFLAALAVNFLWARWWAIRNFDRLVGRLDSAKRRPARPAPPGLETRPAPDGVPDPLAKSV